LGLRAAAKAAMVGGYRSAASFRRAVLPAASADTRPVSTTIGAVDDWYIPDRDVFGPVPTLEEAMAATVDLREAFEMCVTTKTQPDFLLCVSLLKHWCELGEVVVVYF
jgi:hypothetical protein